MPRFLLAVLLCAAITTAATGIASATDTEGYPDISALSARLDALAGMDGVQVAAIGQTASGTDIPVVVIGGPDNDSRPGIAIFGDTGGASAGTPIAIGMAEDLAGMYSSPDHADLFSAVTFYVFPLPCPDGYARIFDSPQAERWVNARPADEDFDFRVDEDGFEDLNGDGVITMMRVASSTGAYRTHPVDPRVLIAVDKNKGEIGDFDLYTEGVDNDGDGRFNEDPPGGVDFNRNFTFNYPYFESGAGVHQVSEPETRAIADYLFDHPNIAVIYSIAATENLIHTWKPGETKGGQRTGIEGRDEPAYKHFNEMYKELLPDGSGLANVPGSGWGAGAFTEWAYFHFGRWSLVSRPWWPGDPPKEEQADEGDSEDVEEPEDAVEDVGDRGKDELKLLGWTDAFDPGRFRDWQAVDHPDFPGKLVEVGGFAPFAGTMPPADELPGLVDFHTSFIVEVAGLLPKPAIEVSDLEVRGAGVYRLTVKVSNLGYLPTESALGDDTRLLYPLQYELTLPEDGALLDGRMRSRVGELGGSGGSREITWLIDAPGGGMVQIEVFSPSIGRATLDVQLNAGGSN